MKKNWHCCDALVYQSLWWRWSSPQIKTHFDIVKEKGISLTENHSNQSCELYKQYLNTKKVFFFFFSKVPITSFGVFLSVNKKTCFHLSTDPLQTKKVRKVPPGLPSSVSAHHLPLFK